MPSTIDPPCLKPADWDGARVVRLPAVHDGRRGVAAPAVAGLGYDQPHTFEFLATSALAGLDKTLAQVEAEAIANLASRKATWQQTAVKVGPGGKLKVLSRRTTTSRPRRSWTRLRAPGAKRLKDRTALAVGVPRRGLLMATTASSRASCWPRSRPGLGAVPPGRVAGDHAGGVRGADRHVVGMLQGGEDVSDEAEEGETDSYVQGLVTRTRRRAWSRW